MTKDELREKIARSIEPNFDKPNDTHISPIVAEFNYHKKRRFALEAADRLIAAGLVKDTP